MKVLMLGWEFPPHISGGLGTACYGLTKGLYEIGGVDTTFIVPHLYGQEEANYVQLFSMSGNQLAANDGSKQGKPVLPELYGLNLMTEVEQYAAHVEDIIARSGEFDIIHAHDWLTYQAGIDAKKISGKPLVVHVHSTEFDRAGKNLDLNICAIERLGMSMADKIIAVSNLTKNVIIDRYQQDPDKIATIYNATEPFVCDKHPQKLTNRKSVVTFLGRLTYQKGPEYFIKAAHKVLQKTSDFSYIMAGTGDLFPEMKTLVSSLGLDTYFEFPGFLNADEVKALLANSDVFVMPSVSEPFGIVALEAINANVPIIISKQSGVAEVIDSAIKVNAWDTDTIAAAIQAILTDATLSAQLTLDAKFESNKLTWLASAIKLKDVYQTLIDGSVYKKNERICRAIDLCQTV